MMAVKVGELKTHLSAYLKQVQNGEKITVTDRSRPIAEIIPISTASNRHSLTVIPAKRPFNTIKLKPLPLKIKVDVLKLLEEDRADR